MDELSLQEFISSLLPSEKQRLASLADTSVDYLYQLVGGHRRPSLRLAQRLVDASAVMFAGEPARQLTLAAIGRIYEAPPFPSTHCVHAEREQ